MNLDIRPVFFEEIKRSEIFEEFLVNTVSEIINKYPAKKKDKNLKVRISAGIWGDHRTTTIIIEKGAYEEPWYSNRRQKVHDLLLKSMRNISEKSNLSIIARIKNVLPYYVWDTSKAPWPF